MTSEGNSERKLQLTVHVLISRHLRKPHKKPDNTHTHTHNCNNNAGEGGLTLSAQLAAAAKKTAKNSCKYTARQGEAAAQKMTLGACCTFLSSYRVVGAN